MSREVRVAEPRSGVDAEGELLDQRDPVGPGKQRLEIAFEFLPGEPRPHLEDLADRDLGFPGVRVRPVDFREIVRDRLVRARKNVVPEGDPDEARDDAFRHRGRGIGGPVVLAVEVFFGHQAVVLDDQEAVDRRQVHRPLIGRQHEAGVQSFLLRGRDGPIAQDERGVVDLVPWRGPAGQGKPEERRDEARNEDGAPVPPPRGRLADSPRADFPARPGPNSTDRFGRSITSLRFHRFSLYASMNSSARHPSGSINMIGERAAENKGQKSQIQEWDRCPAGPDPGRREEGGLRCRVRPPILTPPEPGNIMASLGGHIIEPWRHKRGSSPGS